MSCDGVEADTFNMTLPWHTLQSMQDHRVRSLCIMNVNLQLHSILVITLYLNTAFSSVNYCFHSLQ